MYLNIQAEQRDPVKEIVILVTPGGRPDMMTGRSDLRRRIMQNSHFYEL